MSRIFYIKFRFKSIKIHILFILLSPDKVKVEIKICK